MSAGQATLEIPPPVLEFLAKQRTLTLATASPAAVPRATTVLYVNEGAALYFWSRATTLTARQIQQNPTVAFTVDGSSQDLNAIQGIQGLAECKVLLSGEEIARVADLFGRKFPDLAPGSTMSISFFKITPTELQFIDNTSGSTHAIEGAFGAEFHRERSYSIIQGLPKQLGDTFITALAPSEVAAGETIVREGTPGDKFLLIVEGEADVQRAGVTIETLGAGQLFGEVAIMRDQPRSVSVVARSAVKLLALDRDRFKDLIASAMELTPDFDQVVRQRLDA
ncbi:MAG: hypothetical protein QOF76_926 [Solirubrobacteraceae bacterium]|nr:hypothetical protein [Solirubrobacteraceae bacterium]